MDYVSIFAALDSKFVHQSTVHLRIGVAPTIHTDYFPVLYKRTKTGQIAWYDISVTYHTDEQLAIVDYTKASGIGYRSQHDFGEYSCGVNIGKSNETSYAEQALFDAQSAIRKLKDQGYKEGLPADDLVHNTDADGDVKPMLAQSFNPGKAKFPYLVQPKLNGVRAKLTVNTTQFGKSATLKSRGGKFYTVPVHLLKDALQLPDGIYDGEIYRHGWKLQRITAAVKKMRDDTWELKFVCYDTYTEGVVNSERIKMIQGLFAYLPKTTSLQICPTDWAYTPVELLNLTAQHVRQKYEGSMLRNPSALYQPGFRSKDLLKVKTMLDDEFEITGYKSANGRNAGCIVFRCVQPNGKEFDVNPEGTLAQRRADYLIGESFIGKMLTVRYQELSDEETPIFPVGVMVDREELEGSLT